MAYKENITDRIRRINPKAIGLLREIEKKFMEETGEPLNAAILTEDMTPEEEQLVIVEYYMRQGASIKQAEELAKETLGVLKANGI